MDRSASCVRVARPLSPLVLSFLALGSLALPGPPAGAGAPAPQPAPSAAATLEGRPIALPGATGGLDLDYIACDRATGRVWIPAAGTGSVDVIEPRTLAVTRIQGFPTAVRNVGGHDFVLGPTAIALGEGVAYVGNRGDGRICAIDARKMTIGNCLSLGSTAGDLAASADGLAYVRGAKELWVTLGAPPLGIMPPDRSILVLDASKGTLARKTTVPLEGAAEGYAVDDRHGLFYTNLADENRTVAIDVRSHRVVGQWQPDCGADGPRGLAVDEARRFIFVACTDHVVVLDATRPGAPLSSYATGAGVDNIDYVEPRRELFVAAGKTAMLTVLRVDDHGGLKVSATAPTAPGARVVVADGEGTAYVIDPRGGRILALPRSR